MICPGCGKENAEGNWVCGGCGEPLVSKPQPSLYNNETLPPSTPAPVQTGSGTIPIIIAIVVLVAIFAAAIWFFAFRGPDLSTPGGTMNAYISAIAAGDCEEVYDLTPSDQIQNRDEAVNTCSQFTGLLNVDFTDYKTLEETIDGNNATVRFQVTISAMDQSVPVEMTMQLVKEGGVWKVEPNN